MNGKSDPPLICKASYHDSDQSIPRVCASPECVTVNIPPPQLRPSPKEGFNSLLNYWTDMEQTLSQSLPLTASRCAPPLTNGHTLRRGEAAPPSSGTTSDMDSISNSTSNKLPSGGLSQAPTQSAPSVQSEESSDIDNLSTTYEIVVPTKPPKMKSQIKSPVNFLPPNGIAYGEYANLPVGRNPKSRVIAIERENSPPILPPKSPLLRPSSRNMEVERYPSSPPINGYQTMPQLNGNRHDFAEVKKAPEQRTEAYGVKSTTKHTSHTSRSNYNNLTKPNLRYSFHQPPERPPKIPSLRTANHGGNQNPQDETQFRPLPPRPASAMNTRAKLLPVRYPTTCMTHTPTNVLSMTPGPRMEGNRSPTRLCNTPILRSSSVTRNASTNYHHTSPNGDYLRLDESRIASPYRLRSRMNTRPNSVIRRQNPSKLTSNPANTGGGSSGGGSFGGITKETLSVSPNASTESLIKVRLWPNADGHYGFNVEGGADHNQPITVNRIGENMPAETASPHLHLGDRIIRINDRDISNDTLEQVTSAVRKAAQSSTGLLELIVKPNAKYREEYRVTGTGDVPPRPPRTSPTMETHNSTRDASTATTWLPPASPISQRLNTPSFDHNHQTYQMQQSQNSQHSKLQHQTSSPSVRPKPQSWNYASARARSTSATGSGKTQNSDTESLAASIRNIQNGLADGSLVRQFDELGVGNSEATMLDAKQNNNMKKNRYRDIFPYDHTRVKIQGIDSDYINASFVKTTIPKSGLRVYIASQGPLKTTCADFWQMCWEQRSELIVMLTSLTEKNRETCCQYWPNVNQTSNFPLNNHNSPDVRSSSTSSSSLGKCSQLRICNTKEEKVGHVMYREFRVRRISMASKGVNDAAEFFNISTSPVANDEEVRRIVQLQYISWPDHGVPRDCADLIAFVERMRSLRDRGKSNPVIVHCSAGIGRTGVVILLDTAMDMICGHSPVRPIEIVRQMRKDRDMLIQTPAQFQFVCEAIVRYYQDTLVKRPLPTKGRATTPTDKQS